uniref:CACTA en-spm transposon protein n=1 Tax=Toxocara canis TaxID=6265 RepID=A0A183UU72_TOXCA
MLTEVLPKEIDSEVSEWYNQLAGEAKYLSTIKEKFGVLLFTSTLWEASLHHKNIPRYQQLFLNVRQWFESCRRSTLSACDSSEVAMCACLFGVATQKALLTALNSKNTTLFRSKSDDEHSDTARQLQMAIKAVDFFNIIKIWTWLTGFYLPQDMAIDILKFGWNHSRLRISASSSKVLAKFVPRHLVDAAKPMQEWEVHAILRFPAILSTRQGKWRFGMKGKDASLPICAVQKMQFGDHGTSGKIAERHPVYLYDSVFDTQERLQDGRHTTNHDDQCVDMTKIEWELKVHHLYCDANWGELDRWKRTKRGQGNSMAAKMGEAVCVVDNRDAVTEVYSNLPLPVSSFFRLNIT